MFVTMVFLVFFFLSYNNSGRYIPIQEVSFLSFYFSENTTRFSTRWQISRSSRQLY